MAKSGLKVNTPANGKTIITATALRKDMNRQAASQKMMAQASRLNLSTDNGNKNRPYKMVTIGGATVKRYL